MHKIREIKPSEYSFLQEMLYQAIYVPTNESSLPREIIDTPELQKYSENFGASNDFCLVAEEDSMLIGAIWIRLFTRQNKGYGFVNEETPELSMAVLKECRGQGIGKALLKDMLEKCAPKYKMISLSVQKVNFAYSLYKNYGFVQYSSDKESVIMIKKF